jgi:hypothetical protein
MIQPDPVNRQTWHRVAPPAFARAVLIEPAPLTGMPLARLVVNIYM